MFTPISVKTKTFAQKEKQKYSVVQPYTYLLTLFSECYFKKITYLKKPRFQYFKTCVYPYLMHETTSI